MSNPTKMYFALELELFKLLIGIIKLGNSRTPLQSMIALRVSSSGKTIKKRRAKPIVCSVSNTKTILKYLIGAHDVFLISQIRRDRSHVNNSGAQNAKNMHLEINHHWFSNAHNIVQIQ